MKKNILLRLLSIAVITALFCSAASVFLAQRSYEDELRASLLGTLNGIGRSVSFSGDRNALAKRLAAEYGLARVTIVRKDGVVQGDSEADYHAMENHRARPEVASALSTGSGFSIRRSVTVGQDMLYVAVRLSDGSVLRASVPMRNVNSRVLHMLPVAVLVLLLALAVAVPIAGSFTRSLLRPVRDVVASMEGMRRGDYSALLPKVKYDELSPLIAGVNNLADTIKAQLGELSAQRDKLAFIFDCVTQGIVIVEHDTRVAQINRAACLYLGASEARRDGTLYDYTRFTAILHAAEACLKNRSAAVFDVEDERAGRVLGVSVSPVEGEWIHDGVMVLVSDVTQDRRSSALRREFVANASHELKTPVTSIRGFSELISSGIVTDPDTIRDYIGRIQAEADRMAALIADILTLSSLDESGGAPERERVDVLALAREVAESLAPQAQANHVEITLSGDGVTLFTPREHLRRLLINLIENAVKYNKPGGAVTVRAVRHSALCELTVSDTGIGIPPASIPRIFERFYRVAPGRARTTGGTGLGLAIVKHIVSQLGGSVSVQSTPGEGTTFRVRLPINS